MSQVLDYVGRPGALAIVGAGYVGAVRYCGFPKNPKCTDRGEYEDFSHHALGMALVYEGGTTDWAGGEPAGHVAGARARADATTRIGFPEHRPIYMAIDTEIIGHARHDTVMAYLDGAAAELGGVALAGVYGQISVVQRALEEGHVAFGWQTVAWSHGLRYPGAHLYQHAGYVYPGGVEADANDVLAPDWGQHNAEDDVTLTTTQDGWLHDTRDRVMGMLVQRYTDEDNKQGPYRALDTGDGAFLLGAIAQLGAKVDALAGVLSDDEANIIAAVRAQQNGGQIDLNALAATMAPVLAPILGPLIKAGATADDVRAAVDASLKAILAKAAS
ncbi:glycoside hydrolase domain-containing protein [Actinocrispum wychmicini]|uniref:Uncharacterized protein DUF1906 n=1 Tax=Actinocrispum wychmicini TaxID=1213861 RepID=A0A4R2JDU5_9PSEU|nr:glycoside hydrolase domain-containing protein [Actinocrispum wychmicini]TCO57114.1 uncharacterized protein DUF1906 [Actinocrispum wychmicini]